MVPVPTPPLPGSMTVPPLFGWDAILTVLAVLIALAVVFFLVAAAGRSVDSRSQWQAELAARSRVRTFPEDGSPDGPGEPLRTDPPA